MLQRDEIIEMLRASCDKERVDPEQNGFWVIVTSELEAFAKLVEERIAAKEREWVIDLLNTKYKTTPPSIVQAIRARSQAERGEQHES